MLKLPVAGIVFPLSTLHQQQRASSCRAIVSWHGQAARCGDVPVINPIWTFSSWEQTWALGRSVGRSIKKVFNSRHTISGTNRICGQGGWLTSCRHLTLPDRPYRVRVVLLPVIDRVLSNSFFTLSRAIYVRPSRSVDWRKKCSLYVWDYISPELIQSPPKLLLHEKKNNQESTEWEGWRTILRCFCWWICVFVLFCLLNFSWPNLWSARVGYSTFSSHYNPRPVIYSSRSHHITSRTFVLFIATDKQGTWALQGQYAEALEVLGYAWEWIEIY